MGLGDLCAPHRLDGLGCTWRLQQSSGRPDEFAVRLTQTPALESKARQHRRAIELCGDNRRQR